MADRPEDPKREQDHPDQLFQAVVAEFADDPRVREPEPTGRGFGDSTLKVGSKIFAFLWRGRLVVKLPAARVDALVSSGLAIRFETGGRKMKEWAAVDAAVGRDWSRLAAEARDYVAAVSG